jgi:hypothetical protein
MESGTLHQRRIIDSRSLVPQSRNRHHTNDPNRARKPILRSRLPLLMDRITVEVRVQGLGMYAKLLANTIVQAIGEGETS